MNKLKLAGVWPLLRPPTRPGRNLIPDTSTIEEIGGGWGKHCAVARLATGRCAADLLGGEAAVTGLFQSWELQRWELGLCISDPGTLGSAVSDVE